MPASDGWAGESEHDKAVWADDAACHRAARALDAVEVAIADMTNDKRRSDMIDRLIERLERRRG